MKKILLISLVASLLSFSVKADTASATIISGTMTNIFTGYGKINSIVLTGNTSTNSVGYLVDSLTNSTVYTTSAYTNILSYITNQPYIWTNYFGVLNTNANSSGNNYVLVDVINSVAAGTGTYPSYQMAVAGNSTVLINPANVNMVRGAWFTNSGSGTMTVLLSFTRQ